MTAINNSRMGRVLPDVDPEPSPLVDGLLSPEQTYICLWSHAGGEPVHLHYVVQPISRALMDELGTHGPHLQARMFDAGEPPPAAEVEAFAHRARHALSRAQAS